MQPLHDTVIRRDDPFRHLFERPQLSDLLVGQQPVVSRRHRTQPALIGGPDRVDHECERLVTENVRIHRRLAKLLQKGARWR